MGTKTEYKPGDVVLVRAEVELSHGQTEFVIRDGDGNKATCYGRVDTDQIIGLASEFCHTYDVMPVLRQAMRYAHEHGGLGLYNEARSLAGRLGASDEELAEITAGVAWAYAVRLGVDEDYA